MNEQDVMQKLKSDPQGLKAIMQSQGGQALLGMLSGGDGNSLSSAAKQAASGDMTALTAMLSRVMNTTEGKALVERLEDQLRR